MSERSKKISKLRTDIDARTSYIRAKLGILVPSKIRALRLKSDMPRQSDLAIEANMHQSRVSMFETPGAANVTLETLARLAAAFKVGLIVDFVPFSQMLRWEDTYSQDAFDVTRIDEDIEFTRPEVEVATNSLRVAVAANQGSVAGGDKAEISQVMGIAGPLLKANGRGEATSQEVQAAVGG
jgi:transcriptional regulator with XRE-family HTH domain